MVRSLLALWLLALPASFAVEAAPVQPADSILLHGQVLAFSGPERHEGSGPPRFEQAIAIRDGRIVFIGTSEQAREYAGPKTSVTDLHGRMVMPGIVDGHFHGTRLTDCEMGYEGGTLAEVLVKLQACLDRPDQAAYKGTNIRFSASHFFGEAILPRGTTLDARRPRSAQHYTADLGRPRRRTQVLDEQQGDRERGHRCPRRPSRPVARSVATRTAGRTGSSRTWTSGTGVRPHLFRRRRSSSSFGARLPTPTAWGSRRSSFPATARARSRTGREVQDEGGLTLRANLGLSADFVHGATDIAELRKQIAALEDYRKYAKGLIAVSSVKVYCDGVMEYPAQTAAMLKPYNVNPGTLDDPAWRPGTARGPDPACSDARHGFVELDKAGWQIHVHAIGDRATREALDNFQAARDANGGRDLRHTITHLQAIDEADIPRFARLGVIASMSLQWARRDAYSVNNTAGYIDDTLYQRLYPAAELWRTGAIVAGGSDYPIDPLLPMVQIETAIDHTGEAIPGVFPGALSHKETVDDLLAVIKMHTINSAYQLHMERDTGSIEVGKYADLVVLGQNPFEVPTERISDTTIVQTILGGKVVYSAPPAAAAP